MPKDVTSSEIFLSQAECCHPGSLLQSSGVGSKSIWLASAVNPCKPHSQTVIVRPSGRGTVHSRPHKTFLHFHDLSTLLNKIREGVALSPLSILHKTHLYAN